MSQTCQDKMDTLRYGRLTCDEKPTRWAA